MTIQRLAALLWRALLLSPWLTACKAPPADGASRLASVGSTRIHYQNYGKGPEGLVLIHGWSSNLDAWREQIPELAKRTRVIALDLPGHGGSDKPELKYSMDLFASAVEEVLRTEGVRHAVLVGHSMGTPVARQFYRKYPEQTLAIVIVDGALQPFADKQTLNTLLTSLRGPQYRERGGAMLDLMEGPSPTDEVKQQIRASFLNTPQHVLVSAMEAMGDDAIGGSDPVNVPVLAILAKSSNYPPDIEQRDRAIAPKLELQMWEGVGHFLMLEQPKRFNAAVLEFLDRNGLLKPPQ